MTPIQQLMLGAGGAAKKTYIDDVFSTYLYAGDGASSKAINNGLNLSGEGGLTWVKGRSDNDSHYLLDTVRGANKTLDTSSQNGQATPTDVLTAFNSNGFTLGGSGNTNNIGNTYSSWTFRKAKGFFDVVTWTGTGQ